MAALLISALVLQGCALFARHYPNPPQPLQPTTVGVIAETTQDASGYHAHLVDGRTIDLPQNGIFKLMGRVYDAGELLLAGNAGDGFGAALDPLGSGCWDAASSNDQIVWDDGDSILFITGIELPKAAGYHVSPAPQMVDGRLAWTVPAGNAPRMSFCVDTRGEIEWGKQLQ
jgi:hypothetical protein